MFDWLKRLFGLSDEAKQAEAERGAETSEGAPGMSDPGAGLRHGSTPPGYVPPADEGRPPH